MEKNTTNMKTIVKILTIAFFTIGALTTKAQTTPDEKAQYAKTITDRSDKIVKALGITDSVKYKRVLGVIVEQYRGINDIHNDHDAQVVAIKGQTGVDKAVISAKFKELDAEMNAKVKVNHDKFLANLNAHLNAEQVEKVKDLMTYNVLAVTYKAYLDEIPTLTDVQKAQIKTWLIEAREIAIDGESSKKKHEAFNKYKGRINNYLSAQGYDMKKEGEEWQKRIQAASANKN